MLESVAEGAAAVGQGFEVQYTRWVSAILFNGLGRYEQAFVAARLASAEAPELFLLADVHWMGPGHSESQSLRQWETRVQNGSV